MVSNQERFVNQNQEISIILLLDFDQPYFPRMTDLLFEGSKWQLHFGGSTVRPRDTQPQAARTLQVHVFKKGPKIFEMNKFM